MTTPLKIDRQESTPLYQQLIEQIKAQISAGCLPPGTRLPTVRALAGQLGVTRLTIHTAYSELQAAGWLEAIVGRGTFVAEQPQFDELIRQFSLRVTPDGMLRNLHPLSQLAMMQSLAYTDPDASLFPIHDFWDSMASLRPHAHELLQYSSPYGDTVLRLEVANLLKERQIDAMPDEIILTSGVTQALNVITDSIAYPGDTVLVEHPTYFTLLHVLKMRKLNPVSVPLDDEGPRLDVLEERIQQHSPRLFFTIPNFHNPTGRLMSEQRRRDLLELANYYNLPIIEDDVYAPYNYDGTPLPALKALDKTGIVIYVSGFSKTLMPGVRIGYVMADERYIGTMLEHKLASDIFSPPFVQRALADFIQRGKLKAHMRRIIPHYRARRDAMHNALSQYMPSGVTWDKPTGGLCYWINLPEDDRLSNLYPDALERGIAFTPGEVFMVGPSPTRHMRLCFGNTDERTIHEAVRRLGELITEKLHTKNRSHHYVA